MPAPSQGPSGVFFSPIPVPITRNPPLPQMPHRYVLGHPFPSVVLVDPFLRVHFLFVSGWAQYRITPIFLLHFFSLSNLGVSVLTPPPRVSSISTPLTPPLVLPPRSPNFNPRPVATIVMVDRMPPALHCHVHHSGHATATTVARPGGPPSDVRFFLDGGPHQTCVLVRRPRFATPGWGCRVFLFYYLRSFIFFFRTAQ